MTGGAAGGLLGLIGSWITKREERENLKIQNDHEVRMLELGLKEMEMQASIALSLAEKESEIKIKGEEVKGWTASQKQDDGRIGIVVRAVIRPSITIYLLVVVSWLAYVVWAKTKGVEGWTPAELIGLMQQIITQLLFLTVTCVTWWFGARASSNPPIKSIGGPR